MSYNVGGLNVRFTEQVAEANNEFASSLLRQAKVSMQPGNTLLSPYSVMASLGMLTVGARGDTALEIRTALGLKNLSAPKLARALHQLARISADEEDVCTLAVANRVWAQSDRRLDKSFVHSMAHLFKAAVGRLDFMNDPETARFRVNEWVANQTRGEIEELLPAGSVDTQTRLILTNAIYFQGQWLARFKPKNSKKDKFQACDCDGECRRSSVTMMHQYGAFNYKMDYGSDVQVLEMPYAQSNISMFVLLPDDCRGLAMLEKSLTGRRIRELTSGLRPTNIHVHFPRFEMSYRASLAKILKEMGIRKAFDPRQADLSGIDNTRELYVSETVHQATISVNEEGTTAAAASGVLIQSRMYFRQEFRANRAFIFLIMDQRTGAVLFIGRVVDPRALSNNSPQDEGQIAEAKPTETREPSAKPSVSANRPKQCDDKCPIRKTLVPKDFCAHNYDYAIVGELVAIHELQSRLRYQFHIDRVLQRGSSQIVPKTDQNYLWPKNLYSRCGCGLKIGHKYIIAGHENHKDTKLVLKMNSYVLERSNVRDAIKVKSYIRACRNM